MTQTSVGGGALAASRTTTASSSDRYVAFVVKRPVRS
jgi:hypothetical protein